MRAQLRDREHVRLCDVLAAVPADAPTLCEGWTAHDLAIHIWLLKHDPLSWPALAVAALEPFGRRRADRIRRRWSYPELVGRLRLDGAELACMPGDRFEGHRHALGEYWIHAQDVARPNGVAQPAPDADLQEALWRRARIAAPALRLANRGLVLARPDGRKMRVTPGAPTIQVTGEPTEVILWVYGRTSVADVHVGAVGAGELAA